MKSAREAVLLLQQLLRGGDRNGILALTKFPVQVGETGTVLDEAAFVREYDKVWNPQTIEAVLNQNPENMASGDHFVIGCGEVWFQNTRDRHFRITAFDISEYSNAGMPIADCYRARDFVHQLQVAVASDSRQQVAGMLGYPLNFHGQRKTITLHNAQETLRNYDFIFSSRLRRAIAEQKPSDLLSKAEGVAIGDGFVWISEPSVNGPFKVSSIFEPPLHY